MNAVTRGRWSIGMVLTLAGVAACDKQPVRLPTAQVVLMETPPPPVLLGWLTGMYFFIGLFTAASYALFMDLTDARLGGTQFSTFMAATNGCESGSAWAGGRIVGVANYATAFLALSAVSLLSLPLLKRLAKERGRNP